MALNSSNSNAGSTETKVGAGALSNFNTQNTESKSNGNFSGGDINFDTSKLSTNNPFNTNNSQQPTFNTDDVFKPTLSGNLDIDLPKTNNNNSSINNTTYSNNSPEPTMTVDEVYGKSNNQPVVEKQGDYEASSNEKSNVETSTFGKQDEISVTPLSVTEDKGLVNNDAIQSVEGLNFQQKDKANQEVMEAKKSRDDAEAEDNANGMRNQLKAVAEKDAEETETDAFQVGEKNTFEEENKAKLAKLNQKKQEVENAADKVEQKRNFIEEKTAEWNNLKKEAEAKKQAAKDTKEAIGDLVGSLAELTENPTKTFFNRSKINELKSEMIEDAKNYGLNLDPKGNVQDIARQYTDVVRSKCDKDIESADSFFANVDKAQKILQEEYTNAFIAYQELQTAYETANQEYNTWKAEYWTNAENANVESPSSEAQNSYDAAIDSIKNSTNATPEQQAQAEEAITNLEDSREKLEEAAKKARSGNPADMVAYQEALEQYNKNLKKAQKIGNRFTQTDFNKDYTRAVMDSKDFKVTLSDGTEMDFSDFMTEEVEKSPQYAKAMYEKKAAELEEKHPILAKIERWKAEWSQTTLGSKFTFADNKVRDQFYQFADTNMRATYATNNNVLKDKTGKYSDEDKAEAFKDIEQAKSLKTAAAALKASTGALSGAGDDPSDGTFGTTDVGSLTDDQRMIASIKMFTQAVLGAGISPAANKAYQTYYYLNRGDESVFENDLDNDGFTWVEEYGNNAAAGLILAAGELGTGVVLLFNPASFANGVDLIADAVTNASNSLYGVRNDVKELESMNNEILKYFKEAEQTNGLSEEAHEVITNAITQIEDFQLKSDEVGNLDNWLEGSGSNTASNEKFNQALSYDEWLKLIEADPVMQEYAKSLNR